MYHDEKYEIKNTVIIEVKNIEVSYKMKIFIKYLPLFDIIAGLIGEEDAVKYIYTSAIDPVIEMLDYENEDSFIEVILFKVNYMAIQKTGKSMEQFMQMFNMKNEIKE